MTDCPFCRIYHDRRGVIYENDAFFGIWDRYPAALGHCEVIPKRHAVSLFELEPDEWRHLPAALKDMVDMIEGAKFADIYKAMLDDPLDEKSSRFIREALASPWLGSKPEGYNIGVNEGRAAGRTIDHMHVHIIPRYEGDARQRVGGIRNVLPGKGDYTK